MRSTSLFHMFLSLIFVSAAYYILNFGNPLHFPHPLLTSLTAMFAVYFVFIYLWTTQRTSKHFLGIVLCTSIVAQIIFLLMPAYYNDFWRYLWDGKMVLHGLNPYTITPWNVFDDPNLTHLSQVWYWDALYFKWMEAIYPPTYQYIFGLSNMIVEDSTYALKSVFLLFNIGSIGLGIKILKILGKKPENILYLALNPLFLFESMAGTHAEPILIFFLFLSIYLYLKGKYLLTGISFALLTLTKFFPILVLPFFLKTKHAWKILLTCGITGLVLYLPFLTEFSVLTKSLETFSKEWVMSPGIFALLNNFFIQLLSLDLAIKLSKLTSLGLLGCLILYLMWKKQSDEQLVQNIFWIFTLLLITSSVVFSWYVLWLVCLFPFVEKKAPIVMLSFTILFQYLLIEFDPADNTFKYLENGEVLWNQLLIWIPMLLAFGLLITHSIATTLKRGATDLPPEKVH